MYSIPTRRDIKQQRWFVNIWVFAFPYIVQSKPFCTVCFLLKDTPISNETIEVETQTCNNDVYVLI